MFLTWGLTWHLNSRTHILPILINFYGILCGQREAQAHLSETTKQGHRNKRVQVCRTHTFWVYTWNHQSTPTIFMLDWYLRSHQISAPRKKKYFKLGWRAHGWLHSQNGQLDDQEQFFFWKAYIVHDCNQEIQSLPVDCLPLINHK